MPTAKKLPSGSYRCQVFSHTDATGKRVYKSFTAPTKRQAELLASEFKNGKREVFDDISIYEAVTGYIKVNENILSPSTLYGYECDLKRMKPIHHIKISKISNHVIQQFISDLAIEYSPKTVKNTYGLLTASLAHYAPDLHLRVNLPKRGKKTQYAPNNEEIQQLYSEASSLKLKICIALAAFHSLRRGEIAALKYKDLQKNVLSIHADIVYKRGSGWVYKDYPKTEDSNRYTILPQDLIDMIGTGQPEEYIINLAPNSITRQFETLCKKTGILIRFHDLRHYFASIGAVLGIPTTFLASMGGWENSGQTMKKIYQNKIVSMQDIYAEKMNEYFEKLRAKK